MADSQSITSTITPQSLKLMDQAQMGQLAHKRLGLEQSKLDIELAKLKQRGEAFKAQQGIEKAGMAQRSQDFAALREHQAVQQESEQAFRAEQANLDRESAKRATALQIQLAKAQEQYGFQKAQLAAGVELADMEAKIQIAETRARKEAAIDAAMIAYQEAAQKGQVNWADISRKTITMVEGATQVARDTVPVTQASVNSAIEGAFLDPTIRLSLIRGGDDPVGFAAMLGTPVEDAVTGATFTVLERVQTYMAQGMSSREAEQQAMDDVRVASRGKSQGAKARLYRFLKGFSGWSTGAGAANIGGALFGTPRMDLKYDPADKWRAAKMFARQIGENMAKSPMAGEAGIQRIGEALELVVERTRLIEQGASKQEMEANAAAIKNTGVNSQQLRFHLENIESGIPQYQESIGTRLTAKEKKEFGSNRAVVDALRDVMRIMGRLDYAYETVPGAAQGRAYFASLGDAWQGMDAERALEDPDIIYEILRDVPDEIREKYLQGLDRHVTRLGEATALRQSLGEDLRDMESDLRFTGVREQRGRLRAGDAALKEARQAFGQYGGDVDRALAEFLR